MLNVIPRFIQTRLNQPSEEREGSFRGAVMYTDIAGFTGITEKLMARGQLGAEQLSILINRIYRPLIDTIYSAGGFITAFAGDSITAVFPGKSCDRAAETAEQIKKHFHRNRNRYRKLTGGEDVDAGTGLAFGEISWKIFGSSRKSFCFYGSPVLESASAASAASPGEIIFTDSFPDTIPGSSRECEFPGAGTRIRKSTAAQFVPAGVISAGKSGEFRNVYALFLSFKWLEPSEQLEILVDDILGEAEKFGGYCSGVFFDDKGPHALIVFGAPVAFENSRKRAVEFGFRVCSRQGGNVRVGIAEGRVFAGMVGSVKRCTYTVLGDTVNLAARIMENAEQGQLLVSSRVASSLEMLCKTRRFSSITLKGRSAPAELFEITPRADTPSEAFFQGPIIGRRDELKKLHRYCSPIFHGRSAGVIYLYGDAGVGKSRLVHEFLSELPDSTRFFLMQTDQVLKKALNPFVYLLSGFFRQNGILDEHVRATRFEQVWSDMMNSLESLPDKEKCEPVITELKRTKSFLSALLGAYHSESLHQVLDARGRFENTLFGVKEFIKAQSLLSPVVLVLEDIHWLDSDSKALVKTLTRNTENFPFVIIALSRPDDHGSLPEIELDKSVKKESLILQPLDNSEEMVLVKGLLQAEPDDSLRGFIQERTEGNPFYAEQFCRYLVENELLERSSGNQTCTCSLIRDRVDIPGGINAVIVARIDRLSTRLKELVQTASVLGREFDVQVLSAVLKGSMGNLEPLLLQGETQAIWSAITEISYIFRHSLLRDAVYRMQMRKRLRKLHRLAAVSTAKLYSGERTRFAEIAYHYEMAGDSEEALEYLRKAAEFARDEYRNQEALDLYRRFISLTTVTEDEIDAHLETSNILVDEGERERAEKLIRECSERALQADSKRLQALSFKNLAKLYHRQGNNEDAVKYIKMSREIFAEINDLWGIASSNNVQGNINTVLGNYDDALEDFRKSTEAAEDCGDRITIVLNITNIGNIHLYRYELDKAAEYYRNAMVECDRINDKKALANAYNNMAVVHYYRHEYEKCRELLDRFVEISEEIGNKEGLAYIFGNIGILNRELGDLAGSQTYHNRQFELARELGDLYNQAKATHQIGLILQIQGDFPSAIENILESITICEKTGDLRNAAQCTRDLAVVYLDTGNYPQAEKSFHKAVEYGESGPDMEVAASSRIYLAGLAAKKDQPETAEKLITEAIEIKREMGEPLTLMKTLIGAGEIFLNMGMANKAEPLLKEAEAVEKEDEPGEMLGRYHLARCLLEVGRNIESGIACLKSTLQEYSQDKKLSAEILGHLYRLTEAEEYREKAETFYTELYSKVPRMEYREQLNALKAQ